MGKKSKNRYAKFKAGIKPSQNYSPTFTSNNAESHLTPAKSSYQPGPSSYSLIQSWPIGKELRMITITFAVLVSLLIALSIINQRSSLLVNFSNSISKILHIEE